MGQRQSAEDHEAIVMRYLLLPILSLSWFLAVGCPGTELNLREQAKREWSEKEQIIVVASAGREVDLDDFEEACRFFYRVADISVPGDHSIVAYWYPIPETASALPEIQAWYLLNKDRLYWDPETEKVILKPLVENTE